MSHADSELHRAVVHRPIGSAVSDAGCGRERHGERTACTTEQKGNSWTYNDHNEANVALRLSPPEKAYKYGKGEG